MEPGLTSPECAELAAAKRPIAKLGTALAIHRSASELRGKVVPQKVVRGHRDDEQHRTGLPDRA